MRHLSVSYSNPVAMFMTQALVNNAPTINRSNPLMSPDDQFMFPKSTTLEYNNIDCLIKLTQHPLSFRQLLPFVIQARKSKSSLEKGILPVTYVYIDLLENGSSVNWYWEKKLESLVDRVHMNVEEYDGKKGEEHELWMPSLASYYDS